MIVNYYRNDSTISEISIPDNIKYVDGRVSKGEKYYYKGLGTRYMHHYSHSNDAKLYDILGKSDVFYLGNKVRRKAWVGLSGIFEEKYQPQFSDFIGACGPKELALIDNEGFKLTSIKLHDVTCFDKENKQYYFKVDYTCSRIKFNNTSDVVNLFTIIEYMIENDWNFIWDKNAIADISHEGLVTDLADIFKSNDIMHKIGTIYSLLYSLSKQDEYQASVLLNLFNIDYYEYNSYVIPSIIILEQITGNSYFNIKDELDIIKLIVSGKNCGDCDVLGVGDEVRKKFLTEIEKLRA